MKKNKNLNFFTPSRETGLDTVLINAGISAGFPSPADDYLENKLDLNDYLIKHPKKKFSN